MPSLTQIEYAVAVEKYRHFGQAAKACNVSQPTLSQQLQKLEDELGLIIFDRVQKPIIVTDQGRAFLDQAKVVLREQAKLIEIGKNPLGAVSGQFRLGVIPTIASELIPLIVAPIAKRYPNLELSIEELKTDDIVKAINADQLDGAILATPLEELNFKIHPLYYEPFVLYLSAKHPLLKKNKISVRELDANEIWLLTDGHCFREQVLNFCSIVKSEEAASRNIRFESGNLLTLKSIVQNGIGYTLLPHMMLSAMSTVEIEKHVREFREPKPVREVSFIYRRDHWKLDIIMALENIVREHVPEELPKSRQSKMQVLDICKN